MAEIDEIQRLLRLKRYETPGPNHVEETLTRFHRRQAAELIHRPLWRLALDRFNTSVGPSLAMPQMAYAAVVAAVVIAAAVVITPRFNGLPGLTAKTDNSNNRIRLEASPVPVGYSPDRTRLTVNSDLELLKLLSGLSTPSESPQPSGAVVQRTDSPRYVIDTRPVSYEASLSF